MGLQANARLSIWHVVSFQYEASSHMFSSFARPRVALHFKGCSGKLVVLGYLQARELAKHCEWRDAHEEYVRRYCNIQQ